MKKIKNIQVFPSFKKNIKTFLNSEEGKISKKNVIKAGIILASISGIVDNASAAHSSAITNYRPGTHASHGSHGSHASHGSHGSHSQW